MDISQSRPIAQNETVFDEMPIQTTDHSDQSSKFDPNLVVMYYLVFETKYLYFTLTPSPRTPLPLSHPPHCNLCYHTLLAATPFQSSQLSQSTLFAPVRVVTNLATDTVGIEHGVYMHVCMFACMYVCMHMCTHMHVHIYPFKSLPSSPPFRHDRASWRRLSGVLPP